MYYKAYRGRVPPLVYSLLVFIIADGRLMMNREVIRDIDCIINVEIIQSHLLDFYDCCSPSSIKEAHLIIAMDAVIFFFFFWFAFED